jgi:hypothetical protein
MSIVFLGSWLWLAALAQRRPHHSLVAPSTSAHHRRPSNIVSCLFLWPSQRRTFVLLLTSQWPRREVTQTGELRGSRLLISVPWLQGNWRALLLSDAFTMLRVSGLQRAHAASLAGDSSHHLSGATTECPCPCPASCWPDIKCHLEKASPWPHLGQSRWS